MLLGGVIKVIEPAQAECTMDGIAINVLKQVNDK